MSTAPSPSAASGGIELLVVEDEPLIRLLLVDALLDEGYRVTEAGTALEALAILNRNPAIALVITDVMMPGELTGLDLANWIHEHRQETIVLVTSGYVSDTQALLGSRRFHGFIPKPYAPAAVVEAVRSQLRGGTVVRPSTK